MKLLYDFTVREYCGKNYALANGEAAKRFNGMLEVNDIGAIILSALKTNTSEKKISNLIAHKYDADKKVVYGDVRNFVTNLRKANLIED